MDDDSGRPDWYRAPLLWLVLPLILSYFSARYFLGGYALIWITISAIVLSSAWFLERVGHSRRALAGLCLSAFCLGVGWFHLKTDLPHENWQHFPPREVLLTVELLDNGRNDAYGRTSYIATITQADKHLQRLEKRKTTLTLNLECHSLTAVPHSGTKMQIKGIIQPVIPQHPYENYLIRQGIGYRLNRIQSATVTQPPSPFQSSIQRLRERARDALSHGMAEEYAHLYHAMLLGQRAGIPSETRDLFVRSGTQHLFAISGLHIALIALFIFAALRLFRCPTPFTPLLGLPLLGLYVLLIDSPPSAVRAFIMVSCFWGAISLRRRPDPLAALALSALIVLLWSPLQLWDAGFQLSYAVVLAILLYGLPLASWLHTRTDPYRWWPETSIGKRQQATRQTIRLGITSLAISVSALLGSFFITGGSFGNIAPLGIVFNILAIPLASLVVIIGISSLSLSWIPGAAYLLNHGASATLLLLTSFVSQVDNLPSLLAPTVRNVHPVLTTIALIGTPVACLLAYRCRGPVIRFATLPAVVIILAVLVLRPH